MTSETLFAAAGAIRDEWSSPRGGAWNAVQKFHLAVADLLDHMGEAVGCGDLGWSLRDIDDALAIANAYIGGSS